MSLTFQYLDNFYNVRAQEEVRITGGGVTRYVPTIPGHFPDVDNSFTIWIPRIARLGSSGPIASLVQVPGPP